MLHCEPSLAVNGKHSPVALNNIPDPQTLLWVLVKSASNSLPKLVSHLFLSSVASVSDLPRQKPQGHFEPPFLLTTAYLHSKYLSNLSASLYTKPGCPCLLSGLRHPKLSCGSSCSPSAHSAYCCQWFYTNENPIILLTFLKSLNSSHFSKDNDQDPSKYYIIWPVLISTFFSLCNSALAILTCIYLNLSLCLSPPGLSTLCLLLRVLIFSHFPLYG